MERLRILVVMGIGFFGGTAWGAEAPASAGATFRSHREKGMEGMLEVADQAVD